MSGTFRLGDCLSILKCPFDSVRAGDVIFFRDPISGVETVHRVIRIASNGLLTRGDYCDSMDPYPVTSAHYYGTVSHITRHRRIRRIHGGVQGLLWAHVLRASRLLLFIIAKTIGQPYVWLRKMGVLRPAWRGHVLRLPLATSRGTVVKHIWQGRTIARWWPDDKRWECRKPFDLFLSPPGEAIAPSSRLAMPVPSPEMALLLSCLHPPGVNQHANREGISARIDPEINWAILLGLAREHRVLPLVHHWLSRVPRVPGAVLEELKRYQLRITAFNMRASSELTSLLGTFSDEGLTVIPVKGPVLAMRAYGSTSLRQYEDLDFVVPFGHLLQARDTLVKKGYTLVGMPDSPLHRAYLKTLQDWVFYNESRRHLVDIKPVLLSHLTSRQTDVDWLKTTLQPLIMDHHSIQAPNRIGMLIVSCMHGTNNVWCKASLLADVAALAGQMDSSEWNTLLADAAAIGKTNDVLIGLGLARDILGLELPERVKECRDWDSRIDSLLAMAAGKLIQQGRLESSREAWNFERKTRVNRTDAWRCIYRYVLVPGTVEWGLFKLPPALAFVYTLVRPIRLLGDLMFPCRKRGTVHSLAEHQAKGGKSF